MKFTVKDSKVYFESEHLSEYIEGIQNTSPGDACSLLNQTIKGVYSPSYYQDNHNRDVIQRLSMIYSIAETEIFCVGNILKYKQRAGLKDGKVLIDLMKAFVYRLKAYEISNGSPHHHIPSVSFAKAFK